MISVVLCSYNGENFIAEQIDSIFNQTFDDFELIIIDDCSTDKTVEIINKFCLLNKRISLFINEENLGPRKSFYKGILKSKGDYIALSDQDDIWLPNKLEVLIQKAESEKDALLFYSNSQIINENGELINQFLSDKINPYQGNDNRSVLFYNFVWGHTMFFRRELINYVEPIPLNFNHDKWLTFLSLSYGKVIYVNQVLQYYRHHDKNLTVKYNSKDKLSTHPLIKEGLFIEWLEHIVHSGNKKNYEFFYTLLYNYKKGLIGKIKLFFIFEKYMAVLQYPSKKSYVKKINFLRKIISN
ncbi:glycosyltransferase family 2 protein [Pedobacter alpinus]|uniref:Glycosyltransferase family 2 protein n=1 Tax=Pedobacter alpinus TaxID=1590643 RepID=A0ABW5TXX8_9SPHI